MPNNGAATITPSGTGVVTIPAGYHNGSGTIAQVTVPAANVKAGTTIAGVPGTMTDRGAVTITPSASNQAIPAGYHNGSGSVPAVIVPAANVLVGTTIAGTPGSMPNRGAVNFTPNTSNQTIVAGYHSGSGVVYGDANLVSGKILNGQTIYGVTGNVMPRYFASGTQVCDDSGTFNFKVWSDASNFGCKVIVVTGLTFTPTFICIWTQGVPARGSIVWNNGIPFVAGGAVAGDVYFATSTYLNLLSYANVNGGYVNATGFRMPVNNVAATTYNWIAYG
jgi:hypothetical protein